MCRWILLALLSGVLLAGCGASAAVSVDTAFTPPPEEVVDDKGEAVLDGCRSGMEHTEAWTCVYGDPGSDESVVLWGDSHAMQFVPPMIRLAERKGWRLVTLFRGSCLTADAPFEPACDAWRMNALNRIARESPDLVVTATDTGNGYALARDGVQLSREESGDLLREAYTRTLDRLAEITGRRAGSVVVIRDLPRAEHPPPDCLARNRDRPETCDFEGVRRDPPGFDLEAAHDVRGARLVDPGPEVCPGDRCPAVRDGKVVYRDTAHLSATYAVTLTDWLEEQIGELPAKGSDGGG
jgi:hypothetical protein